MDSLSDFLLIPAGAFLCNSIPHLAAGLRGEVFPTPFAKPRGKGPSSALVNFYWGAANLALGLFILLRVLGRHAFLHSARPTWRRRAADRDLSVAAFRAGAAVADRLRRSAELTSPQTTGASDDRHARPQIA
ncbi:MAG: hypothetical protein WDM85_12710 [Caulobacteraceae bacterium]